MTTSAALVLCALAIPSCKGSDEAAAPPAAGSAPAPVVRPSQQPLARLPAPAAPGAPAVVALGHALFFEPRLSGQGDRSCASCHVGGGGVPLARRAPALWNVALHERPDGQGALGWDGRSPTLEASALAEWRGDAMAGGDVEARAAALAKLPELAPRFAAAFPGAPVAAARIAEAIAAYERTLLCDDTAYDRFAAGDRAALTDAQQRGLDLFLGKGQCLICHAPPAFSTAVGAPGGVYENVGIGTAGRAEDRVDVGRFAVSHDPRDWAAFRPPALRDVARRAPYFHDGSVATLDEAVALMASGGIANRNRNPALVDRGLSAGERADLIAFLGALACGGRIAPP